MAVSAIVAATVVSAGSAYYTAEKQEDAAAEARRAQEKANEEAQARQKQVMLDSVSSESATTSYGIDKKAGEIKASNDLLIPRQADVSLGGSSSRTGLGF